uniref:X8 domain-containing protein n=1 Tax=Oryza barthii TaxID=65489 RepID=A0A0D3GXK3_9ORYZ
MAPAPLAGGRLVLVVVVAAACMARWSEGIGVNWGTQLSHPLPASTVVQLLKDNGFDRVKLFDAEDGILAALKGSGIQVMVGIPNDMLADLAAGAKAADDWVATNVSNHVNNGVDIRYVAVGNEPFLETFNGTYLNTTFPAMQSVQAALKKAGLADKVKVTVPLNADVYQSPTGKPSDGDFRADIHGLMLTIVQFLADTGAPFVANNTFDANHDTLVAALRRNGYPNVSIIVGEVGWPTDGDANANSQYARQFNQGFLTHIASGQGTPLRPGPVDAYLFSLIDEDQKSIEPGNFERHWGVFYYDGQPKYPLSLRGGGNGNGNGSTLMPAKGVTYLQRRWCVMKPSASLADQKVGDSVSYACGLADCTSLGYKTSCGGLDAKGNVSYAFNSYYQVNDQDDRACDFKGIATTTTVDPSAGSCRFIIEIAPTANGVAMAATVRVAGVMAAILAAFIHLVVPVF